LTDIENCTGGNGLYNSNVCIIHLFLIFEGLNADYVKLISEKYFLIENDKMTKNVKPSKRSQVRIHDGGNTKTAMRNVLE
jgi:hypothetical protein